MNLKYDYNSSIFYNEDAISYYLLGAFITDGCVYKNKNTYACQLSSIDRDWLNIIKNLIGTNLKLHKFRENYFGIRIMRNEIAQWFIEHGCTPQKTYDIKLPNIPNIYFRDFLRGCIDGDGSIGTYVYNKNIKRSCQLISASESFLIEIREELKKYSIHATITNRGKQNSVLNGKIIKATVNSYSLNFYGLNCFKFLEFIYYENNVISLQRKKEKAQEIITYYNNMPIKDLRKISKFNKTNKIQWPIDQELINKINKSNIEKVAIELGVHGTAIRAHLKRRKLYDQIIKGQKVIVPSKEELAKLLQNYSILELSKKLDIGYKTLRLKIKKLNIQ